MRSENDDPFACTDRYLPAEKPEDLFFTQKKGRYGEITNSYDVPVFPSSGSFDMAYPYIANHQGPSWHCEVAKTTGIYRRFVTEARSQRATDR